MAIDKYLRAVFPLDLVNSEKNCKRNKNGNREERNENDLFLFLFGMSLFNDPFKKRQSDVSSLLPFRAGDECHYQYSFWHDQISFTFRISCQEAIKYIWTFATQTWIPIGAKLFVVITSRNVTSRLCHVVYVDWFTFNIGHKFIKYVGINVCISKYTRVRLVKWSKYVFWIEWKHWFLKLLIKLKKVVNTEKVYYIIHNHGVQYDWYQWILLCAFGFCSCCRHGQSLK